MQPALQAAPQVAVPQRAEGPEGAAVGAAAPEAAAPKVMAPAPVVSEEVPHKELIAAKEEAVPVAEQQVPAPVRVGEIGEAPAAVAPGAAAAREERRKERGPFGGPLHKLTKEVRKFFTEE